jgi:hypothetical protein
MIEPPVRDRSIYARAISPKFIIREYKQTNLPTLTLIMAPTTPLPGPLERANATTTRKSRY